MPHMIITFLLAVFGAVPPARATQPQAASDLGTASEATVRHILDGHASDAATEEFCQRLKVLDGAVAKITASFEHCRDSALDRVAAAAFAPIPAATQRAVLYFSPTVADLFVQYEDSLAAPFQLPALEQRDRTVLVEYYRGRLEAAEHHVWDRARVMLADAASRSDALSFVLLFPLLRTPDARWSSSDTTRLPLWARQGQHVRVLERFALSMRRPRTAYQIALCRSARPDDQRAGAVAYWTSSADKLIESNDFAAAIACLSAGIETSETSTPSYAELVSRLSQLYDDTNQPSLAADCVQRLMNHETGAPYGKAVVLRARYLYNARRYDELVRELTTYRADPRCAGGQADLIFLGWLALRDRDEAAAERWQREFLERFPNHPSGAQIYMAAAQRLVAEKKFEQARRVLGYTQYCYPNWAKTEDFRKLIERVSECAHQ